MNEFEGIYLKMLELKQPPPEGTGVLRTWQDGQGRTLDTTERIWYLARSIAVKRLGCGVEGISQVPSVATYSKGGSQPLCDGEPAADGAPCDHPAKLVSRPSFPEIYMKTALLLAERSTCQRLNVGCVVTSSDFMKVLAVGYNGNASGLPNACDSTEPGKCGCIHAEQNAVINCDSPRQIEKLVFTTALPCPMCAKFVVNLGNVKRVYYNQDYRVKEGLVILSRCGIQAELLELE